MHKKIPLTRVACTDCAMHALCSPVQLGDETFSVVKDLLKPNQFVKSGDFLFRQGDTFHSIFAVCSGGVKLTTTSASNHSEHVTGFYYPGELVGTNAISQKFYSTNAIALSGTRICELPYHQIEIMSQFIPGIMTVIYKLMSSELALHQEMTIMLTGNRCAEEQLAAFLINVAHRLGQHGQSENKFKLRMSRLDIGNHLGLAKETVSRLMKRFQNQGLLDIRGRECDFLDVQHLRNMISS